MSLVVVLSCCMGKTPGGTGKTFLINLFLANMRKESNIAIIMVSSRIIASMVDGRKTDHFTFQLPINLIHSKIPLCNISKENDMTKMLWKCKIIE